jgi:hypothetical protein
MLPIEDWNVASYNGIMIASSKKNILYVINWIHLPKKKPPWHTITSTRTMPPLTLIDSFQPDSSWTQPSRI